MPAFSLAQPVFYRVQPLSGVGDPNIIWFSRHLACSPLRGVDYCDYYLFCFRLLVQPKSFSKGKEGVKLVNY